MGSIETPHLDITIDEYEIENGAIEVIKKIRPTWPLEELKFKKFTNGITNKVMGVWYGDHYNEMIMIKVYGRKTSLLIRREDELYIIQILHKAAFTHSIYATYNNGFAYQFIRGDTLTIEELRNPSVFQLIARRMAYMHKLKPEWYDGTEESCIWDRLRECFRLMPTDFLDGPTQARFEKLIKPYTVLKENYELLDKEYNQIYHRLVFAHNDLLPGNIIYNKEGNNVTFIDFEYSGYNYQPFDIANHFVEFAGIDNPDYSLYPDEEFQKAWITEYLMEYDYTDKVVPENVIFMQQQVHKWTRLTHFFWGCWALLQSAYSSIDFDYLGYAAIRFDQYFIEKEKWEVFVKNHGSSLRTNFVLNRPEVQNDDL